MREVLMPSPVVVVCVGVERSKEKISSDFEGLNCYSSSLRNTTAGEAVAS